MGINVLSCFDGISCGQLALERAGIQVDNYYASEIDKYAIKVTQTRFPKTIQLGTIVNWKSWDLPHIDLIIAGSPCQGFSNAGQGLNFEDPRSKLFFVFCDILVFYKPENYMLENVKMKKEWKDTITDYMKVEPVLINSALVSAQERKRLYWANWEFGQPEDKKIYLKDILESGVVDREKSYVIDANYYKGGKPKVRIVDGQEKLVFERQSHRRSMVRDGVIIKTIAHGYVKEKISVSDKYPSLCAQSPRSKHLIFVAGIEKGRRLHDGKNHSRNFREGMRIYSQDGKSPALTAKPKGGEGGYSGLVQVGTDEKLFGHDIQKRVYSPNGKSPTLLAISSGGAIPPKVASDEIHYRKLTVLECERLQTLPDGYTDCGISNTQRYKCIGNGWTVDVIAHILLALKPKLHGVNP